MRSAGLGGSDMATFKELPSLGLNRRERKAVGLMIKYGLETYTDPYAGRPLTVSVALKKRRIWLFNLEYEGYPSRTTMVKVSKRYSD